MYNSLLEEEINWKDEKTKMIIDFNSILYFIDQWIDNQNYFKRNYWNEIKMKIIIFLDKLVFFDYNEKIKNKEIKWKNILINILISIEEIPDLIIDENYLKEINKRKISFDNLSYLIQRMHKKIIIKLKIIDIKNFGKKINGKKYL